jgi:hypothetical protein
LKNYKVSTGVSTAKGRLRHVRLYLRRPVKKAMIFRKNQKTRLNFAREHRNWQPCYGRGSSRMMTLSTIRLVLMKYGRLDGKRMNVRYIVPTVKHSGGIKIFGCFSRDEMGPLHRVEGNMDKLVDSMFF